MAGDEYFAAPGSLKLKNSSDISKKKKKSKKDKEKKLKEAMNKQDFSELEDVPKSFPKTAAEQKFEERRRRKEEERILKKASQTHKEKVEEFNRHLDNLTEHFDIPKVSWTK